MLRTSDLNSCRVGAAQDLLALNIDMASVMQAGRWRDTRMPMRYGEEVLMRRGRGLRQRHWVTMGDAYRAENERLLSDERIVQILRAFAKLFSCICR